jgi:hypothetical protein
MRGLRPAGRAHHDVAGADRVALRAEAQGPGAGEDHEHLLIGMVVMERPGPLARRHLGQAAAEQAGAECGPDPAPARLVSVAVGLGHQGDVGDGEDGVSSRALPGVVPDDPTGARLRVETPWVEGSSVITRIASIKTDVVPDLIRAPMSMEVHLF